MWLRCLSKFVILVISSEKEIQQVKVWEVWLKSIFIHLSTGPWFLTQSHYFAFAHENGNDSISFLCVCVCVCFWLTFFSILSLFPIDLRYIFFDKFPKTAQPNREDFFQWAGNPLTNLSLRLTWLIWFLTDSKALYAAKTILITSSLFTCSQIPSPSGDLSTVTS